MFSTQSFGASDATIPMGGMGLGMDSQAAAETQAAKPAKKEDRVSVLPVSVRVLEDAASTAKASGADTILVHGSEPGMVLFVGCVESVTKQTSSAEFVVNDSTGRMRVKYYSNEADTALASIEEGKYITVAGTLRTTPAVHVSAQSLRAVRSADEISYHMIEVAHAMLKLTRPQPTKDVVMTQAAITATPPPREVAAAPMSTSDVTMTPAKETVPVAAAPAAAAPAAKSGQALDGPALRAEVLKVLSAIHAENPSEEGVHKDKVFSAIATTPQANVMAMLKQLDEEGEIFSTINDDFYAPM